MVDCVFAYDGAKIYDGDGSSFDLVLPHAEAGRAYAFLIELAGQTASQFKATFYQAGAAAGAAGSPHCFGEACRRCWLVEI